MDVKSLREPLVALGVLSGLLLLSLLFVHLPAQIYGGNAGELGFPLFAYVAVGSVAVGILGAATGWLLVTLPARVRRLAVALLCGVAVVAWLYGTVSTGGSIVLDGRHPVSALDTPLGKWELVVAAGIVALLGALALRATRLVVIFLAVLNVGLLGGTAWEVFRDPRLARPLASPDTGDLFRFSRHGNALVVLMDTLQADVFERIVRADPALLAALDGFTLFRDATGVAPTTMLSIPAIHAGTVYRPGQRIDAYYDETIRRGSFLNRLADAGFRASLVNPMQDICPERVTLCVPAAALVGNPVVDLGKSSLELLDFAIFRSVPFALKSSVQNGNRWLLSSLVHQNIFADAILDGNELLELIAAEAVAGDGPPQAKFIHLLDTHPPFILAGDCTTIAEEAPLHLDSQVRCSLQSFAKLLEALKREAAYDATAIVLIADHGYAFPSAYVDPAERYSRWAGMVGAANPTFAVKPRGAHGVLARSDTPVALSDLGATVCAMLDVDCRGVAGVDILHFAHDGPRPFAWYEWQQAWWSLPSLAAEQLSQFSLTGPLWKRASWHEQGSLAQGYRIGTMLDFRGSGARPALSTLEWSPAEAHGTWADGHEASLLLKLDAAPNTELHLLATTFAFLPDARSIQRVGVFANGVEVAQWVFDGANNEAERRARIPRELLQSDTLRITFVLPDAVSPAALHRSTDTRTLSLGVRQLRLVAHTP